MKSKKTMGVNPLEEYLSSKKSPVEPATKSEPVSVQKKQRITIHLPVDLIDRVKNAVYWEAGLTLTGFAEYALEKALDEQEAKRGQAYPERKERTLKSGRPLV